MFNVGVKFNFGGRRCMNFLPNCDGVHTPTFAFYNPKHPRLALLPLLKPKPNCNQTYTSCLTHVNTRVRHVIN